MTTVVLAAGITAKYPSQKAVAFQVSYGRKWKAGDSPRKVKLGSLLFPIGEGIEDGEARLRKAFPQANASNLWDEFGNWFCAGSML